MEKISAELVSSAVRFYDQNPDAQSFGLQLSAGSVLGVLEVFYKKDSHRSRIFRLTNDHRHPSWTESSFSDEYFEFNFKAGTKTATEFKTQILETSLGHWDSKSYGLTFCDGSCDDLCCDIRSKMEPYELHFHGVWTEDEKRKLGKKLSGGGFPEDLSYFWHELGLEYGAGTHYLAAPGEIDVIDRTELNYGAFEGFMNSTEKWQVLEVFEPNEWTLSPRLPVLKPSEAGPAQKVGIIIRTPGEYKGHPIFSLTVTRTEEEKKLFRTETHTVTYVLGDLGEWFSARLYERMKSKSDLKLEGEWIQAAEDSENVTLGYVKVRAAGVCKT